MRHHSGRIGDEAFCKEVVDRTVSELGKLDILVNNAAEQHPQESIENISAQQLERTFRTNIFSMFYLTKAAMKHLKKGGVIISTTSVTAYKGSAELLDYSSTKGAIVAFTRSLSQNLADKGIRVNGVAPGPIWTPPIRRRSTRRRSRASVLTCRSAGRANLRKLRRASCFWHPTTRRT